jgi:hypothetical protein
MGVFAVSWVLGSWELLCIRSGYIGVSYTIKFYVTYPEKKNKKNKKLCSLINNLNPLLGWGQRESSPIPMSSVIICSRRFPTSTLVGPDTCKVYQINIFITHQVDPANKRSCILSRTKDGHSRPCSSEQTRAQKPPS